jgi:two-component system response regulator DevR
MTNTVLNSGAPADPSSTATIRVFLMDDHELVRRGLVDLLKSEPDITVVGEAGTAADALHRIPGARPDVALLDGRLPDGSGIDVCREIRSSYPNIRCVILTSFDDDEALFSAIMAGASGYLLKEVGGSNLVTGIRQVAAGQSLIDPAVTQKLLDRLRNPVKESSMLDQLTPREREILNLITDGHTNRQIGEKLFLAEKTVKNYVSILLTKLGMQRRTQAAVYGAQQRSAR